MTRRTRTAKTLAKRIDLSYFKRPHPFRRWRVILSLAAPLVALVWLASQAAAGSKAAYSSGPVSAPHAAFGERCEVCHVTPASGFRAHVTDTACAVCHDAPPHKTNETFTPACASCHLEHRGRVQLAAVGERSCLQCHDNLQTRTGATVVATRVGSFDGAHPEFAAVARGASTDRTALRFNHQVHLKADLRGASGPVTLECQTCHNPQAGLMTPMSYEGQCASCHPLFFDPLIDRPAPHESPEIVRAHVARALRSYIEAHPEQVGRPDIVRGRIPVNFPFETVAPAGTPEAWAARRTAAAERLLWGKTCRECHVMSPGTPPSIAAPAIPDVWMPRAQFDHAVHRLVTCEGCHAVRASRETSDVLMPGIATCRRCHTGDRKAETRCFECHQYHDWSKAKPVRPGFTLDQLTGERR